MLKPGGGIKFALKCETPAFAGGRSYLLLNLVWQVRIINPQFLKKYLSFVFSCLSLFSTGWGIDTISAQSPKWMVNRDES